jgi:formylglycine-generating enzyme required for sulfatase activity
VHVEPFFVDATPVTNKQFEKFVRSTYYESEAEHFGWSFVLESFFSSALSGKIEEVDPEAEYWVAVEGAYWRRPEGPDSTYKLRETHPVTHVPQGCGRILCVGWKAIAGRT